MPAQSIAASRVDHSPCGSDSSLGAQSLRTCLDTHATGPLGMPLMSLGDGDLPERLLEASRSQHIFQKMHGRRGRRPPQSGGAAKTEGEDPPANAHRLMTIEGGGTIAGVGEDTSSDSSSSGHRRFQANDVVMLTGLTKLAFNGQRAIVLPMKGLSSKRVAVKIEGRQKEMLVRREKLVLLHPEQDAEEDAVNRCSEDEGHSAMLSLHPGTVVQDEEGWRRGMFRTGATVEVGDAVMLKGPRNSSLNHLQGVVLSPSEGARGRDKFQVLLDEGRTINVSVENLVKIEALDKDDEDADDDIPPLATWQLRDGDGGDRWLLGLPTKHKPGGTRMEELEKQRRKIEEGDWETETAA
eukprot:CAMPEP_0175709154 /NCGR_PEP_ID=MMETSP0097-20121207/39427_1 /TAXON_ID=311494 /ORGANISM="Alexandrium monilatum, Strain CCMP3105" /LENGTH=352 /DNA_ID=CAMNT_0017016547 /DNA_START=37 /DNA_END=1092 /DNA_ORIENTATION=+